MARRATPASRTPGIRLLQRCRSRGSRRLSRALACAALLASPGRAQTAIHVIDGAAAGDWLGWQVAGVGDLDGDGVADLVLGAPLADQRSGRVDLRSGADGSLLYSLHGGAPGDQFGWSVDGLGDLDGDGYAELVIGVDYEGANLAPGAAEVRSGATGALLFRFEAAVEGDRFGSAVAGAGDVNGDLVDDILVGAPASVAAGPAAGIARVFSGADGSLLHTLYGSSAGGALGTSVAGTGDLDGDGLGDLLVGAPGTGNQAGRALVFSGADGSVLYTFEGDQAGDRLGQAVGGAGDVDGDGVPDLIVGAPFGGTNDSGAARVLSGADGGTLHVFEGTLPQDRFGWSVSGAGDVDLDGRADLVVGSPTSWRDGAQMGSIHVFAGADGELLYSLYQGSALGWFGESVAAAGDLNANGVPDLVVGAPFESANGGASGRARGIEGLDEVAARFCFGDGGGAPCPCGNEGGPYRGCASSAGSGAILSSVASGSTSASADDLVLTAIRLVPDQPTLLFAGRNQPAGGDGVPFGDGLRCAGGDVIRLGVQVPGQACSATFGPGLITANGLSAGESWNFQAWYRDPAGPCGLGFNLSNGVAVTLAP